MRSLAARYRENGAPRRTAQAALVHYIPVQLLQRKTPLISPLIMFNNVLKHV